MTHPVDPFLRIPIGPRDARHAVVESHLVVHETLDSTRQQVAVYEIAEADGHMIATTIWIGSAEIAKQAPCGEMPPHTPIATRPRLHGRTLREPKLQAAAASGVNIAQAIETRRFPPEIPKTPTAAPQTPRHANSDEDLAYIAKLYTKIAADGSTHVARDLHQRLAAEGRYYTRSGVRSMIHRARKRGLLAPATASQIGAATE